MQQYTSDNITQLEGLEAIRQLPGMYIGNNSLYGLHHLIMEVFANSADEVLNGYGSLITVRIEQDGTVCIVDDGRGIPIEWKDDSGMSALTQVMTLLHAGGKFAQGNAYASSGGLHGIGLKAVNAMSLRVNVEVRRGGLIFRQAFHDGGQPKSAVQIYNVGQKTPVGEITSRTHIEWARNGHIKAVKEGAKKLPVQPDSVLRSGTEIAFLPNAAWFDESLDWNGTPPWDFERLRTKFLQLSFLNPGLRIEFEDKRGNKARRETFYSEHGLADYIAYLNEGLDAAHQTITFKGQASDNDDIVVEIAMQYTKDGEETQIYSFVNGIPTPQGGTHVSGFQAGLTKAINKLAKVKTAIKGDDLLLGLSAIVNVTIRNKKPQFSSQTKDSLVTAEARGVAYSVTYNELCSILESQRKVVNAIAQQAEAAARGREAAKKARSLVVRKSVLEANDDNLLAKLADITSDSQIPKEETMLFLVEGDSAGGSAKQARDRTRHAILPLRGKIINVEKTNVLKVLKNTEVQAIVATIGGGFGSDFDVEKMRYGRIVIMTDADVDGFHIRALLYNLFWRYLRPIVEQGLLCVADPPLYRVYDGKQEQYCYTEKERRIAQERFGERTKVQRYKGLGEMSPEQLRETVMTPGQERLLHVEVEDVHRVSENMRMLMGGDTAGRKAWIINTWQQSA